MLKKTIKFRLLIISAILLSASANAWASSEKLIIDTHEHIQSVNQADDLVSAMNAAGVKKTILAPSPIETLTLNGNQTFTEYQDNVNEILKITEKYPDRFIPFCTISPLDPNAADILKDCHERGGVGLKLYNGHSYYYDNFGMPLDSPVMDPIYEYAEKEKMPVLYHVNAEQYGDELERVLAKYPNMAVSIPHYMVTGLDFAKIEHILDTYPNTYTDISFGNDPFLAEGFMMISGNVKKYQDFFAKYQDRILFGADMVLTDNAKKDMGYIKSVIDCYKNILEKKTFSCPISTNYYKTAYLDFFRSLLSCNPKVGKFCQLKKEKYKSAHKTLIKARRLNGLSLDAGILKKIYSENPMKFLNANNQ